MIDQSVPPLIVDLPSLTATQTFGRILGQRLWPGSVVALVGVLGAGKTHLARAIAEGLDIPDSRIVNSPTFVLVQEYRARLPIYHFDAYRLRTEGEFADLGVHEYFEGDGVCLVEWADRVPHCLPHDHLQVTLTILGETSRRARIEGTGSACGKLLNELKSQSQSQSQESGVRSQSQCSVH